MCIFVILVWLSQWGVAVIGEVFPVICFTKILHTYMQYNDNEDRRNISNIFR